MKKAFYLILVLLPNYLFAQLTIGGDYNVGLYKPYSSVYENHSTNRHTINNIYSFSNRIYYSFEIQSKHNLSLGINLLNTRIEHKNFIDSVIVYHYEYGANPEVVDTTKAFFPISLIENSIRIGLYFDYQYVLFSRKKHIGKIGICSAISIYEYANARFENELSSLNIESNNPATWQAKYSYPGAPYNTAPFSYFSHFYIASADLSFFYRQYYQVSPNFSLAARISLGTNLYSDWDQFKKYAWLGLGLEMGFGKVKASKVNP
jgi:hypothetical protein